MEITIPPFDAGAALVDGLNPTIISLQGCTTAETLELRNSGSGKAYFHSVRPAPDDALKGYPLGFNTADNELGEGRSVGGSRNGVATTLYITSDTGTALRVLRS